MMKGLSKQIRVSQWLAIGGMITAIASLLFLFGDGLKMYWSDAEYGLSWDGQWHWQYRNVQTAYSFIFGGSARVIGVSDEGPFTMDESLAGFAPVALTASIIMAFSLVGAILATLFAFQKKKWASVLHVLFGVLFLASAVMMLLVKEDAFRCLFNGPSSDEEGFRRLMELWHVALGYGFISAGALGIASGLLLSASGILGLGKKEYKRSVSKPMPQ